MGAAPALRTETGAWLGCTPGHWSVAPLAIIASYLHPRGRLECKPQGAAPLRGTGRAGCQPPRLPSCCREWGGPPSPPEMRLSCPVRPKSPTGHPGNMALGEGCPQYHSHLPGGPATPPGSGTGRLFPFLPLRVPSNNREEILSSAAVQDTPVCGLFPGRGPRPTGRKPSGGGKQAPGSADFSRQWSPGLKEASHTSFPKCQVVSGPQGLPPSSTSKRCHSLARQATPGSPRAQAALLKPHFRGSGSLSLGNPTFWPDVEGKPHLATRDLAVHSPRGPQKRSPIWSVPAVPPCPGPRPRLPEGDSRGPPKPYF